jgi:hypothetical protein
MPLSLPTLQELPSVHAALTWLLGDGCENADGDVASARVKGLIQSEDSPHWKVDGDMAVQRAKSALPRLPDDSDQLGNILHGLGEMAARSHARALLPLLVNALKARRGQLRLEKVLDAVVKCDTAIPRQVRVGELALAQWLSRARLEWNTFDAAVVRIQHPNDLIGGARFGLRFAARAILSADPTVIDEWIATHPDHLAIAAIGSAALSMVFPFDDEAMVAPVLESKNVGIKCLGAASIVCPVGLGPVHKKLSHNYHTSRRIAGRGFTRGSHSS